MLDPFTKPFASFSSFQGYFLKVAMMSLICYSVKYGSMENWIYYTFISLNWQPSKKKWNEWISANAFINCRQIIENWYNFKRIIFAFLHFYQTELILESKWLKTYIYYWRAVNDNECPMVKLCVSKQHLTIEPPVTLHRSCFPFINSFRWE